MFVVEKISLGVCMKDILLCGLGVWYAGWTLCGGYGEREQGPCVCVVCLVAEYGGNDM